MRVEGGLIDRARSLNFTFDGEIYRGHPGDTLASALLANGVRLMGRSFKYHRPRGVLSAGPEEPNALVTLERGPHAEPNTRATVAELYDGLKAESQNRFPSLRTDLMAVNDLLSPFLSAGFYYKTFMWPAAFWERVYEPIIRKAAGLGALSMQEDGAAYDHGFRHCDVLIIGAGPAGLSAALSAGRSGCRVILADEDFVMGGRLNAETHEVNGAPGSVWAQGALAELAAMDNVRLMPRSTVYGAFDGGVYGALERVTDHLGPHANGPRQVLWRIYARRAILAAGAIERPIAFADNDRPGVMLAGAARAYANRWGVLAGKRVGVFTNNDDGWRTAQDLSAKGAEVVAIVDSREVTPEAPAGAQVFTGAAVTGTTGRLGLKTITVNGDGAIPVDLLAVSGGWSPTVHLTCHMRGRPVWRDDIAAFVPDGAPPGMTVAGAANGALTLAAAMAEGRAAAAEVVDALGKAPDTSDAPVAEDEAKAVSAFWHVKGTKRAWIDFQNDVTAKDVILSRQEGFRSVEHLKRYTTLGMATDQGKTANIPGLAVMAEAEGKTIPEVGATIFRPPYTPVPIGAFAGRSRGKEFRPTRLTPSHQWAEEQGAVFVETGAWLRAQWYPRKGETHWRQSVDREVLATRNSVGVCDVTTLGKIDIQGADAAEFLNRIYANAFGKLAVSKVRYGLMLREDGIVMDDGTTARFAEDHFVMTTTTANAVGVMRHLEFCRQCLWPGLDVHLISTTEQWAQFAVAGPKSRRTLEKIVGADISNDAFPFMACAEVPILGVMGRLFRISFSGELAYEIAVPTQFGDGLIRAIMEAGAEFDITPYGTEALGVMRIEKGHAAGNELNGTTTARNLGLGRMISAGKDCIGKTLSMRAGLCRDGDLELVGLRPVNPADPLSAGAHFLAEGAEATAVNDQGYLTSVAHSPALNSAIGLGFVRNGQARIGERLRAWDGVRGRDVLVTIASPHFIDPEGERLRA